MEECWICKRNKQELEYHLIKKTGYIIDDFMLIHTIKGEKSWRNDKTFKNLQVKMCGVCVALLNGFIDNRVECINEIKT